MKVFNKILPVFIALFLMANSAFAQNFSDFGKIPSKYFGINDFESAPQIWWGTQGDDGTVFFGNNIDILSFNGVDWKKVSVDTLKTSKAARDISEFSSVDCIKKLSNGTIAIGRENNFGILRYDSKGKLVYVPLFTTTDSELLGHVWNVFEIADGSIRFIGENGIYNYKKNKVEKVKLESKWKEYETKTSTRVGKGVLIVYQHKYLLGKDGKKERKYQFMDLKSGKISEISLPENCSIRNIRGSFQDNGVWYVVDVDSDENNILIQYNDLFGKHIWTKVNTNKFPAFNQGTCFSISQFDNNLFISTEKNGLIVSYTNGQIIRQYIDEKEIDNSFVHYAFLDRNKNIWCCLERGIQIIETNSPITSFGRLDGINSQIETIDFKSGFPLIGNHQDVFIPSRELNKNLFTSLDIYFQNIFDIKTFKTSQGLKTIIIANDGIFELDSRNPKGSAKKEIIKEYAWQMCQSNLNKDEIYFTLEQGLGLMKLQKDGSWKFEVIQEVSEGKTNSITCYNGKIYYPSKGIGINVYDLKTKKLSMLPFKKLLEANSYSLIGNSNVSIEVFQNNIVVGTYKGLYKLDQKKNKLVSFHPVYMNGKGTIENSIHRIKNIDNRQLWVVFTRKNSSGKLDKVTGWFEKTKGGMQWITAPLSLLKTGGLPYSIEKNPNSNEVWIGTEDGLYILNQNSVGRKHNTLKVFFDKLEMYGKVKFYNLSHVKQNVEIKYKDNSFKFHFYSNSFSSIGPNLYSYKLEGYSDDWTEWSELTYADFVKITEGEYTLKVKVKSFYGEESEVESFKFTVLPPWYRTVWAYILYVIIAIFLVFLAIQISTARVKKQKTKLEEIVVERTSEIAEQNKQLEQQKAEIVQKTTDILDSIHYAKRIQNTILPSETRLNELFEDHFVFYRPKDIVSGDFYWAREVQDTILFSAIDCTGHGVPGALVSFVGNNGLLRCVSELKLSEPAEILDNLREIVVKAFQTGVNFDVKDGMDMAICSIDPKTNMLKFAGAYNECIIVRNGEIIELKPDKQPIGLFDNAKPFNQHEFQLQDNDCIYMTTDGYVDQFGGEKQKKFKAKQFKEMLTQIYQKPMKEQYEILATTFDNWKWGLDQVDDVCVFGVKYKMKQDA